MADQAGDSNTQLLVEFTELKTRLDVVIGRHDRSIDDHEARLRAHDNAISKAQSTADRAVTPKALWGGLLGAVGAAAGLTTLLSPIFNR